MGKMVLGGQPCPVHGGGDSVAIYEDGSAHCFNMECNKHWGPGSYDFDAGEFGTPKKKRTTKKDDDFEEDDDEDDGLGDIDVDDDSEFVERDPDHKPARANSSYSKKANRARSKDDPSDKVKKLRELLKPGKYTRRKVSKEVMEQYRCLVSYNPDGTEKAVYYGYTVDSDGNAQGYKKRILPKDFSDGSVGTIKGTFGRGLFQSAGPRIVITEGEDDAMVLQEAYWRKYQRFMPIISLRGASATKDLIEEREELRRYDKIIFWLDKDGPGQKALKEAAKIVGYDKAQVAHSPYKDAGEHAEALGLEKVLQPVWDAEDYRPAGILNGKDLWERVVTYNEKPCIPYPPFMEGLNEKLGGMRFGEITLWTSGTGSGKSTLMREIMYHLSKVAKLAQEDNEAMKESEFYKELIKVAPSMEHYNWNEVPKIGVVSLEESPEETARKLAGMALNRNPAKEDIPIEELQPGFEEVFGDGNIMVLDHQGSIDDGSVMDHLEFMCLSGCKFLFVDHITILVSEGQGGLTGNEAIDKVMNDMLKLVKKHDAWLGLISHLRKTPNDKKSFEEGRIPSMDDIKGSGSIKQISFDIIGFARNQISDNEEERNTVNTKVLKCRYTGKTGPSGSFHYNFDTGRMDPGSDRFMKKDGEFEVI